MDRTKANILASKATCNRMHDMDMCATEIENEAHSVVSVWCRGCKWTSRLYSRDGDVIAIYPSPLARLGDVKAHSSDEPEDVDVSLIRLGMFLLHLSAAAATHPLHRLLHRL